ncbi:UNVERIFIED_CONTAM: QWRF motif-containing protein 2, partial [Sesamum angustifolium]
MMVAAVSGAASTTDPQNPKINASQDEHARRPPLLPSEKDNSNGVSNNQKRPKSRIVSSRYMSPSSSTSTSNSSSVSSSSSSSRRYPSPLVPRNSTPLSNAPSLGSKRSVSVDRRRPAAARPLTRSLSLPISKTKVAPTSPNLSSVRKGTPERRRTSTPLRGKADWVLDQAENSKPADSACDQMASQESIGGSTSTSGSSVDNEASVPADLTASDSDSVSSGSTSGVQDCNGASRLRNGPRGIAVSARFWQETNSRLRRLQDPGSPLSTSPAKLIVPKLKPCDGDHRLHGQCHLLFVRVLDLLHL